MYLLSGKSGDWELVVGLEVHAQLSTKSKLFSGSSCEYGMEPNSCVAFVDVAMPGALPLLNMEAVRLGIMVGVSMDGDICDKVVFDRKHYFYPDLAGGYQITQFFSPLVRNGYLDIRLSDAQKKRVRICEMHLEQDAGKTVHDYAASCVDFNRAGVPLLEIVTMPDFSSPEETVIFAEDLRRNLMYIGACSGDMEKGCFRFDANVSVKPKDSIELGVRCEIKNLNSFKSLEQAIECEARHQIDVIESGGKVLQETKLFDIDARATRAMREKEGAIDYMYFPEQDLRPLSIPVNFISDIRDNIPELPSDIMCRYKEHYGLSDDEIGLIIRDPRVVRFFESVLISDFDPKMVCNWIVVELFSYLNKNNIDIESSPVSSDDMIDLLTEIKNGKISGKIAKKILAIMFEEGKKVSEIISDNEDYCVINDVSVLEGVIDKIIDANLDKVAEYRSGKTKVFGFLMGQIMKESSGKADPVVTKDLLQKKIEG